MLMSLTFTIVTHIPAASPKSSHAFLLREETGRVEEDDTRGRERLEHLHPSQHAVDLNQSQLTDAPESFAAVSRRDVAVDAAKRGCVRNL